jgi:hypothetical protein
LVRFGHGGLLLVCYNIFEYYHCRYGLSTVLLCHEVRCVIIDSADTT